MLQNDFYKSDQGTKAAWKGFSSQTVYIAYRLLFLDDDKDFYPEKIEDLMLRKDGVTYELVQVKNLATDLSLSDLSPKESDSFFRRSLANKTDNENLIIKVVSFGEIGPEMLGLQHNLETSRESIKAKLLKFNYSDSDIVWILKHLVIEKVQEHDLLSKITEKLGDIIETMAAPNIVLDVLTNYVAGLSRIGGCTSREKWFQTVRKIGIDLASVSGLAKQYGNTILPIFEYKNNKSIDNLRKDYLLGVNALPQHIRANLDVTRSLWINKIKTAFEDQNIVVVKGASGQGKSSLAYRFLLDNYAECDILCIERISSEAQAIDIRSALAGIAKNRKSPIMAYMDVSPYDTNWLWLCEKVHSQNIEVKLLITIREEDFHRSPIDYSKHFFNEIELAFSKDEAVQLFDLYRNHNFLSFDDAWTSFGGSGPLMEFTYMLNQSETLKNKLSAQIQRISKEETYADEWLQALTVISYAGKFSLPVGISDLFSVISCTQKRKMLDEFEKEYFVRKCDNEKQIECLHAVRASLLFDLLKDDSLFPELDVLISALNTVSENALMMIVAYIYSNNIDDILVDRLASIQFKSWSMYAGVVKALLWGEVYTYYQKNKSLIKEGDALVNSSFSMICLGDITGLVREINMDAFWKIVEKSNPHARANTQGIINRLSSRHISYYFVDSFINKTICKLPLHRQIPMGDLTAAGYCLFWLAKRGAIIPENAQELTLENWENPDLLDEFLNYAVGVQMQGWESVYNSMSLFLRNQLQLKYNLVSLNEYGSEISVVSIIDVFDKNGEKQFSHNHIMSIVNSLRRYSINKIKYNVELIGCQIVEGITIPDMQKHIPADNLPWTWVTQLNGWLIKLCEYDYMPPTWNDCLENINNVRGTFVNVVKSMAVGLDYLYKKGNLHKLTSSEHVSILQEANKLSNDMYAYFPQSEVDKYGISLSNTIVQDLRKNLDLNDMVEKPKNTFNAAFRKYCSSFKNFVMQKDALIIDRIKENPVSEQGRLSLVNIISALDELPTLQKLYRNEFSTKQVEFNDSEEYEGLLLLSAIWTHMYNNRFRTENSLLYARNEYIKSYRRKIVSFFEKEVLQLDGVLSGSKQNTIVEITVNGELVDEVCTELFTRIKRNFPEVSMLTLEGFLWEEFFSELQIKLHFLGEILPGGFKIPSINFKIYTEVDKFLKYRTPIENIDFVLEDNAKNAALKCFANLQSLHMIARYIVQINATIKDLDGMCFNHDIYELWQQKVNKLIVDVFKEIQVNLCLIFDALESKSEHDIAFNNINKLIDELQVNAVVIARSADMDELTILLNDIRRVITNYIDTLPHKIFC